MSDQLPPSAYGESDDVEDAGIGDAEPRCDNIVPGHGVCNRKLAEFVTRPWEIMCQRCKHVNSRQ